MQNEVVVAEFELAAGGRAGAGAPDDGVLVRTLVNTSGGPEAIAPADSRGVGEGAQPMRG